MDKNEQLAELRGILDRVQLLTSHADNKVGIVTAIQAILCTFLFPEMADWYRAPHTTSLVAATLAGSWLLLFVGIGFSLKALLPNIANPRRSATFFGSIAHWAWDEYGAHLSAMTDEDWRADYLSQIHTCSQVANAKYVDIRRSIRAFVVGLLSLGIAYVLAMRGL